MITETCKEVIKLKLEAFDQFFEEYIEPLLDVGSPEKLIGKPYEEWTQFDFQVLSQIYGEKLEKYIFNKEYKKVLEEEHA